MGLLTNQLVYFIYCYYSAKRMIVVIVGSLLPLSRRGDIVIRTE